MRNGSPGNREFYPEQLGPLLLRNRSARRDAATGARGRDLRGAATPARGAHRGTAGRTGNGAGAARRSAAGRTRLPRAGRGRRARARCRSAGALPRCRPAPACRRRTRRRRTAVVRDRKLALPVAPNRLPEAPLPKTAPMSAPLPCWIRIRPIIASAVRICSTSTRFRTMFILVRLRWCPWRGRRSGGGPADGGEMPAPSATRRRSGRRRCRPGAKQLGRVVRPSRCRRRGSQTAAARVVGRASWRAQQRVHLLRLRRASPSCRCRSPRPARRRPRSRRSQSPWRSITARQLPLDDRPRSGPASRSASVSPTQTIGVRPVRQRRGRPSRPPAASVSPCSGAPLRMADDDVAAAELREHRRRHLAGEGAAARGWSSPARPSAIGAALQQPSATCAEVGRRHADGDARPDTVPRSRSAASSASLAARLPFIFQLPATRPARPLAPALTTCSTILPMCRFDSISACASRRLGGREDLWITGLTRAALEPAARPCCFSAAAIARLERDRARPQRRAGDGEALAQHQAGIDLALDAALHRDDDQPAVLGQALELARDVAAGDHVEDDVDAPCRR